MAQLVKLLTLAHDLVVHEFEPQVRLCADSSELGACFRFCVSLSLCPFPARSLSLSLSLSLFLSLTLKNKISIKKIYEELKIINMPLDDFTDTLVGASTNSTAGDKQH